ncbi:MAG: hypothetical protein D6737_08350 [Chloroflexi bacterium]|nr:MAG: hypothetical protein D6737_08350 [Chloroflexota bacterium]
MKKAVREELQSIAETIANGKSATAVERQWKKFLKAHIEPGTHPDDIAAIVQYIMSEAQVQMNAAVQNLGGGADHIKELKKQAAEGSKLIRAEIDSQKKANKRVMTKAEKELSAAAKEAKKANQQLQKLLQKQSETYSAMPKLSKMMNDTAAAIMQNN